MVYDDLNILTNQKYIVLPEIFEVKKYNNDESAFFNLYMHCPISWNLRHGNVWEPHLHRVFEKYINKDSVVIEGGCHLGSHSVKLSKLSKKLYCFEPLKESYNLLKTNLRNNKCFNTIVSDSGLSDELGVDQFAWMPFGNLGGSGLSNNPMGVPGFPGMESTEQEKYDITLTTIDFLNLDQLDFIKLDVEGYEPKVIMGGIKTITKFRPVITLECWANHYGMVDIDHTKNVFKMLLDLNYTVEQINLSDFLFLPQ
jgi:FkbM family methyltransferase